MEPRIRTRKPAEKLLAGESLTLTALLEAIPSVAALREVARKFGMSPAGFRIEKAPAKVLAELLAKERDPSRMDEVLSLVLPPETRGSAPAAGGDEHPDGESGEPAVGQASTNDGEELATLRRRIAEFDRQRGEQLRQVQDLERARDGLARALQRETELQQRVQGKNEELTLLRAELERARRTTSSQAAPSNEPQVRSLTTRLHELEQEIEARDQADEALRRQMALDRTRSRELEEEVRELEELLPKGKRRRKVAEEPPALTAEKRFHVPMFQPSFYKSAMSLDRASVQRAFDAVMTYCTYGPSYPGLQVKPMAGQDTWSMRASLGIRVYFRPLADGDIEVIEMANREDQHTMLRRLKER